LQVPVPGGIGAQSPAFAHPFTIVDWIEGTTAHMTRLPDTAAAARRTTRAQPGALRHVPRHIGTVWSAVMSSGQPLNECLCRHAPPKYHLAKTAKLTRRSWDKTGFLPLIIGSLSHPVTSARERRDEWQAP
jgi:hypothetical protein